MSEPSPNERPRQVTLVGWLTMVGSAAVVVLVFDRLTGLHTLETRQSVEAFLAEPPGRDLGLGVDGVLSIIRTLAMVTAGCATAAAILGYHVLRRHRGARLALTVLAVPLFLAGLVTGGFVSSLVAASVTMLWVQPSRDWFDGVTRRVPEPGTAGSAAIPHGATAPAAAAVPASRARPGGVAVACVLTFVACGLTVLGLVATGVLLAIEPDTLLDEVHRQNPELSSQGVTDTMLLVVTFAMIAAIVLWCVSAVVLGVLVLRGVAWARIVLVVSASTAAALSLIGTAIGAFLLAITLVASVGTLALLMRADVRAWFSGQPGRR